MAPESFELARLRMRRPRLSDADAMFVIGSDPAVARYAEWPLSTERGPALERLRGRAEQWESGAEYYWVITLAGEDRAIGAVSTRVAQHTADVGYLLDRTRRAARSPSSAERSRGRAPSISDLAARGIEVEYRLPA